MARLARTGNSSVAVTTLMLYPRRAEGGGGNVSLRNSPEALEISIDKLLCFASSSSSVHFSADRSIRRSAVNLLRHPAPPRCRPR